MAYASSISICAHKSMYLHFPETCILCGDLWSFINTTPTPREETEKAATYKTQKRSQYQER